MDTAQASLPLFQRSTATGTGAAGAGGRADDVAVPGVELRRRPAREVLYRTPGPFPWAVDPYRSFRPSGARRLLAAAGGRTDAGRAGDGPRVVVEDGAQWALLRTLRRRDLAGQPIALGAQADPYLPAPGAALEEKLGVTRSLLETLTSAEGLTLSLTTRSPLVLRDLDLLIRLDRRHAVTLNVPVPALDAELTEALDPTTPPPDDRLATLAALAAEGLTVRLLIRPLAPAINDSADLVEPLLAAARDAGAVDVVAHCLELRGAARTRVLDWLARDHPRLLPRYRALYGRRGTLRQADKNRTLKEFRRLRLAHGFPRRQPGRG